MTKLLISVRDQQELASLPAEHLGIVDVKEPIHGALGRASNEVVQQVLSSVDARWPVSAALGELFELKEEALKELPKVQFAKFGLSGCQNRANWKERWRQQIARLPTETIPVAVVYADWKQCGAPSPNDVICAGLEFGCKVVLIDTLTKDLGSVFDVLEFETLQQIEQEARLRKMKLVLAGGISSRVDLERALRLEPDFIGVRGAVCTQGRKTHLDKAAGRKFSDQFGQLLNRSSLEIGR